MNYFFITIAVLLFVAVFSGGGVYLYNRRSNTPALPELPSVPEPELSIQSVHSIIMSEIQNLKELATLQNNFHSVVSFEESKKVFGHDVPGTTRKFKLNYSGTIICGCDLTKIIIDKDFHNKNHLSITLPTSQVLHIYPNIDTFEVYDVSAGIFTSDIEIEDQNREVAKDLEEVKERKIQDGILLKSNENARKLLRGITTPLGVEAEIKFVDFNEEPLQLNQGE